MFSIQDMGNKLIFDLLTLKMVSELRVTWATSVPILVFLGLSVLELGPMYATDRRQTDRRQTKASLNASAPIMVIGNNLQSEKYAHLPGSFQCTHMHIYLGLKKTNK